MREKTESIKVTVIRCPDCHSTNTLHRALDNSHGCRKCGRRFKIIADGKTRRLPKKLNT